MKYEERSETEKEERHGLKPAAASWEDRAAAGGIPNPVNWKLDVGVFNAYYEPIGTPDHYYVESGNGQRRVQPGLVSGDVLLGLRSPLTYAMGAAGLLAYTGVGTVPALTFIGAGLVARSVGAIQAYQGAQVYNGIHYDSYMQH